jgi:hypothetical membrane protein
VKRKAIDHASCYFVIEPNESKKADNRKSAALAYGGYPIMVRPAKLLTPVHAKPSGTRRLTIVTGILAPVLFIVWYTIDGFLHPGYWQLRQQISDLGRGPYAWVFALDMLVLGCMLILFARGFIEEMRPLIGEPYAKASGRLLVAVGFAVWVVGLFAEYVPGDPNTLVSGTLHGIGFALGLILLSGAMLIVGQPLRHVAGWHRFGQYSATAGIVTLSLLVITLVHHFLTNVTFILTLYSHFGGLIERIVIVEAFAWYVVVAGWLLTRKRNL